MKASAPAWLAAAGVNSRRPKAAQEVPKEMLIAPAVLEITSEAECLIQVNRDHPRLGVCVRFKAWVGLSTIVPLLQVNGGRRRVESSGGIGPAPPKRRLKGRVAAWSPCAAGVGSAPPAGSASMSIQGRGLRSRRCGLWLTGSSGAAITLAGADLLSADLGRGAWRHQAKRWKA